MSMAVVSKQWTRVRTLGPGASGAEVFLAADDASGELFAVKSASASGAAALRREQWIMAGLRSPRVVSCIGGCEGRDGSYQLFLEFAPGGSLADEVVKSGRLEELAVRAYTADVTAGLAYLHGAGTVHGDVKARNVVIGADGRAKLADFGCAKMDGDGGKFIGGTPAFMAPEVAREEEQGPAADVWALGCTVIEMATGRAPWSGMDGHALAAMHRIGCTDAVPEVPQWLSNEAKDFLGMCLIRRPSQRCTAGQLLEHPFLASAAGCDAKLEDVVKSKWASPKSTLDGAFWESDSDTEDELSVSHSSVERIKTSQTLKNARVLSVSYERSLVDRPMREVELPRPFLVPTVPHLRGPHARGKETGAALVSLICPNPVPISSSLQAIRRRFRESVTGESVACVQEDLVEFGDGLRRSAAEIEGGEVRARGRIPRGSAWSPGPEGESARQCGELRAGGRIRASVRGALRRRAKPRGSAGSSAPESESCGSAAVRGCWGSTLLDRELALRGEGAVTSTTVLAVEDDEATVRDKGRGALL